MRGRIKKKSWKSVATLKYLRNIFILPTRTVRGYLLVCALKQHRFHLAFVFCFVVKKVFFSIKIQLRIKILIIVKLSFFV